MSTVNNNPQVQAGGRTALIPDSPYVFIGGKRFRVQVLKNGQFEDSHIDSRHIGQVQRVYDRVFNEMSPDAKDRILNAETNREVVIFDHTQDGRVNSLSTVSRDSYDARAPRLSGNPALTVDQLFRAKQDEHLYELKAIGQALRSEPLNPQPAPFAPPPPLQSLLGLSDAGMRICGHVRQCMTNIIPGTLPDHALQTLQTTDPEAHTVFTQLAGLCSVNPAQAIMDPYFYLILLGHLRSSHAGDSSLIHQIPPNEFTHDNFSVIVDKAMDYILKNPNADSEVQIQLARGTPPQQTALRYMNSIMQRLGTRTNYETANHPSWRLIFLDIIAPPAPIQPQQQNPVAPVAQGPTRQETDAYYAELEEADTLADGIDDDVDQDFSQTAQTLNKRITVYNEATQSYTSYTPRSMNNDAPFGRDDICLKINQDDELVQMVAATESNSGDTSDDDDDDE